MINHDALIDMFALALNGSDVTMDARGKYHPLYLQQILGEAHADIVNIDPSMASDMSIDYTATIVETSDVYTAALSKKTIGSRGIFRIKSGSDDFSIASREEFRQLSTISGQKLCELSGANTLTFSQRPAGFPSVTVTMVPAFSEMEGSDPVIMEGQEVKLFKVAFDMIRRDNLIQDKLNNSRIDGGNGQ